MSNIIQTRPHNRLRLIAIPSAFQSSAPDSRAPEDARRCYRFVSVWCALCVGVQSPAMRGSSDLIELTQGSVSAQRSVSLLYWSGVSNGTACELEGLSSAFAGLLPHCALSGLFPERKGNYDSRRPQRHTSATKELREAGSRN